MKKFRLTESVQIQVPFFNPNFTAQLISAATHLHRDYASPSDAVNVDLSGSENLLMARQTVLKVQSIRSSSPSHGFTM